MLARSLLVARIFRVINFLIIIGLFAYIFWRYLLNPIKQKIAEKKAAQDRLKLSKDAAKQEVENLKIAALQQKELEKELTNKINIWKIAVDKSNVREENLQELTQKELTQRRIQQQANLETAMLENKTFPIAIEESKKNAIKKFQESSEMQNYINKLIAFMKSNI